MTLRGNQNPSNSLSRGARVHKYWKWYFFIQISFVTLWIELSPFSFLILKEFYKGFQMRYHLFLNSVWKVVKLLKIISPKSAVRRYMSTSVDILQLFFFCQKHNQTTFIDGTQVKQAIFTAKTFTVRLKINWYHFPQILCPQKNL